MGAGRPKWIPQYRDRVLYSKLKKQGLNDQLIADEMEISWDVLKKNKKLLLKNMAKIEARIKSKHRIKPDLGLTSALEGHPLVDPRVLRIFAEVGYPKSRISELIGCTPSTLNRYLENHPKLNKAFTLGKEFADVKVMKALMKRATGMKVPKLKFASDKGVFTDTKKYYEVLPPETNAAFYWLINRQKWTRDNEPQRENRQGKILESVEKMIEISDEKLKEFDK